MHELITAFKEFIYRDFYYCVSGGVIILFVKDALTLPISSVEGYDLILSLMFVGIANAVGYANQEIWCQTPIATTHLNHKYNKVLRFLYRIHCGKSWLSKIDDFKGDLSRFDDKRLARHGDQKLLGVAMGTCLLTVSLVLAFRQEWLLSAGSSLLSVAFLLVGWVKGMQQKERLFDLASTVNAPRAKRKVRPKATSLRAR